MSDRVFHVEFGINETELTRYLEYHEFSAAERIIRTRAYESYLDEGCYQRIPLYIVLCGTDDEDGNQDVRNLYLANLLIRYGANVNRRVPQTFYGCEYGGPGKTPLELITNFYNDITQSRDGEEDPWDCIQQPVIGLDNHQLTNKNRVISDILHLTFNIIDYGANVNIKDENKLTCVHRTLIKSEDLRLLQLLIDSDADIYALDKVGNTPLISLCSVSNYIDDCDEQSECSVDVSRQLPPIKNEFIKYLLFYYDSKVNNQNKYGQTALYHCMARNDFDSTLLLLQAGADPTLKGTAWKTRKMARKISPLFASFIHTPFGSKSFKNISRLVDSGYFNVYPVYEELMDIIWSDLSNFHNVDHLGVAVISELFGGVSQSLKQRATSVLFERFVEIYRERKLSTDSVESLDSFYGNCDRSPRHYRHPGQSSNRLCNHSDDDDDDGVNIIKRDTLYDLVSSLPLPRDVLVYFDIELLRLHLFDLLSRYFPAPPTGRVQGLPGLEYVVESDSESPSEGGDSDIEYW